MNDKPFIKLLKSPLFFYFYDVNTNEIVKIDEIVYGYLNNYLSRNKKEPNGTIIKGIELLRDLGYLKSKKPISIEHPESKWLSYHYERNMSKITLQLTQNCNLRCSYCVYSNDAYSQRKHSGKRMNFDIAKKSVDFLLKNSIDSGRLNIGFYGGEPLLEFDLLKDIVCYVKAESIGREITFSITTNGTLLTKEIARYILDNKIVTLISLDGPKNIHDKSRRFANNGKGSFDKIISNVKNVIAEYPSISELISFNMVINPQNDYDYIHSIRNKHKFLNDLSFRSSMIDDVNSIEKTIMSDTYREKMEYNIFLAFLAKIKGINGWSGGSSASEYIASFDSENDKFIQRKELSDQFSPGGPCIPGQLRLLINTDGNFYPCERVSETSPKMNIGNINEGISISKAEQLINIGKLTENLCKDCWAISACKLCCKYVDDGINLNGQLKKKYCLNIQNAFKEFLLDKIMIQEINNMN